VLQNPDPAPQTTFGQGSGTENSDTLGDTVESGQDNFVYVRTLNRGAAAATNVMATVYWAPPATLPTPNLWNLIGSTLLPSVPAGNQLTVSNAIVWPSAAIPGLGHYCFVALIGAAGDPAPPLAALANWTNFERFIRENNNVTWRNFNVVNNVPPAQSAAPPGFVALPFLAVGAPDEAVEMELEIVGALPHGARALIAAQPHTLDQLRIVGPRIKLDELARPIEKRAPGWQAIAISPHGPHAIARAQFPAGARFALQLFVQIPKEHLARSFDIAARQLFKGREVGRITWRLAPLKEKPRAQAKEREAGLVTV
jgi:hypothetical protein